MDAYEEHKKIQETITLVDIYQTLAVRSSQWDAKIEKGLKELSEKARIFLLRYLRFALHA